MSIIIHFLSCYFVERNIRELHHYRAYIYCQNI